MAEAARKRATALGPHDIFLLDQWGRQLVEAFDSMPYLVGSTTKGAKSWRDVDVRMELPAQLSEVSDLLLRTINLACSLWGRHVTGLPIDFQVQRAEEFHSYDVPGHARNPLGPRSKVGWRLA